MAISARTTTLRAVALAVVVLVLLTGALPAGSPPASAAPLEAGSDFTVSSRISSSNLSPDHPALLLPGVTRFLWYTVSNPLGQPITVTDLSVLAVDAPPTCPLANLDLGDLRFAGAFDVPAGSELAVPAPKPITLKDLPDVNQDGCKRVTFTFSYVGTARFAEDPDPEVKVGTATVVTASPNPVVLGRPVTLRARVTHAPDLSPDPAPSLTGDPTGAVTFHLLGQPSGETLLGTSPLEGDGVAVLTVTTLPAGKGRVLARYQGDDTHRGSTSPPVTQEVVAPPAPCTGTYTTWTIAPASASVITGTAANDFIYAVRGSVTVRAGRGNDCVVVGNGTNVVFDGPGADVVIAGDGRNRIKLLGSRNTLVVGHGGGNVVAVKGTRKSSGLRRNANGNRVTIGDGAGNRLTVARGRLNQIAVGDGGDNLVKLRKGRRAVISVGHGAGNRVKVRRTPFSRVAVGDGAGNRVRLSGRRNVLSVGDGSDNRITLRAKRRGTVVVGDGSGNRLRIRSGRGHRILLGSGKGNRVVASPRVRATCSLPQPPSWWTGAAERWYDDTIVRCRVVTR